MNITTTVTQANIEKGQPKCNDGCPLALSFKNHATVRHVSIFETYAWLFMKNPDKNITHVRQYNFSKKMYEFVHGFDNGETVEPQEFTFTDEMLTSDKYL